MLFARVYTSRGTTRIPDVLDFALNSSLSAFDSAWVRSNEYSPGALVASSSDALVSVSAVTAPSSFET